MNMKTVIKARDIYTENLKAQQNWYGLTDEQLGTADKFINSFVHYLEWIEHNNMCVEEE